MDRKSLKSLVSIIMCLCQIFGWQGADDKLYGEIYYHSNDDMKFKHVKIQ